MSCAQHKMKKIESRSKVLNDTGYVIPKEVIPDIEYYEEVYEEEYVSPPMSAESPEMSIEPEEHIHTPNPISSGSPPPEPIEIILDTAPTSHVIDDFTKGDIMYLIQDSMVVGEVSVVNMTISYGVESTEIVAEIETFSDESIYTEEIRIAPVMKARLTDITGNQFTIIPVTPEEQFLEFNSYTRWVWNVTPLSEGNHKLALSVDVMLNGKGKTIEVYDDFIYVYSTQSFFSKVWEFFLENWKWFASSLFLPLFYFIFKQFRKKS